MTTKEQAATEGRGVLVWRDAPKGWTGAYRYTCAGCGAKESGSLGHGFFGEPTDNLPDGWLRKNGGFNVYACSVDCAEKVEQAATSNPGGDR